MSSNLTASATYKHFAFKPPSAFCPRNCWGRILKSVQTPSSKPVLLTPTNHDRDRVGMTYVYPVVSRRAGGVSLGVNLNPTNACNWACVYCQVPNLVRGTAPPVNLAQLETELRSMLNDIMHGDFMQTQVSEDMRRLNDIALSGNGEPTSAREFAAVIQLIGTLLAEFGLPGIKLVLITNGSLIDRKPVQAGLRAMAKVAGSRSMRPDDLARELGLAPFLVRKAKGQLAGWSPPGLEDAIVAGDAPPSICRTVSDAVSPRPSAPRVMAVRNSVTS